MAFQRENLKFVHCPRCNGRAAIKIERPEQMKESGRILLFVVCDTCRLRTFYGTTNEKAIKYEIKIQKLNEKLQFEPESSQLRQHINATIERMQKLKARAEIDFR